VTIRRPIYVCFLTLVLVLGGQDTQPSVSDGADSFNNEVSVSSQQEIAGQTAPQDIKLTDEFQPLLTPDLERWKVWTGVPHKSVDVPGHPKSTSEDEKKGTPIGLSDPLKIYSIEMVNDEPILRVSGQAFAGLTSLQEFENYHLTLEYKWGKEKFPPRKNQVRDSGLLYHCTGKHGKFWNVWMRCLECQIQENDTGDLFLLGGTSAKVKLESNFKIGKPQYAEKGELSIVGVGTENWGAKRLKSHEDGDWERVDVYTLGTSSIFAVNGVVVMRLQDAKNGTQSNGTPLSKGKLQIQSEAAEISYRRVKIRKLEKLPTGNTFVND
jgi:hypothetical protein